VFEINSIGSESGWMVLLDVLDLGRSG